MENYDYAQSCKPSRGMVHAVETKNRQKATNMLYCRVGQTTRDKIFTDLGAFYIATQGIPVPTDGSAVNLGELWVTYKVKLSRAQIFDSAGLNNATLRDDFLARSTTATLVADTTNYYISNADYVTFYNAPAVGRSASRKTNTLGGYTTSSSPRRTQYVFPELVSNGLYQVTIYIFQGAVQSNSWGALQTNGLCSLVGPVGIDSQYGNYLNSASTAAEQIMTTTFFVTVNAPGSTQASFYIDTTADCPTGTTSIVMITECPAKLGLGPEFI